MSDHIKLQNMLELLLALDCTFGKTISDLANKFQVSERTIFRYIQTFRTVGFVIEHTNGAYKIQKLNSTNQDISKLLHFSEEEAFILQKAIHSIEKSSSLQTKLVQKLYALYDTNRIVFSITPAEQTDNILLLIQAIKQQKQVVLKEYRSSNSQNIQDRLVEPLEFTLHYASVWCFDIESNSMKQFNTARIGQVIILDQFWQFKYQHLVGKTDVFRMSGLNAFPIQIALYLKAYNLLLEEFPMAEQYCKQQDNLYVLSCTVTSFKGIGRFILGLMDQIIILESVELKAYIKSEIQNNILFS